MSKILESITDDLIYLSETDPTTAVPCEIMKIFIQCYLIKNIQGESFHSTIDCNKLIQIEKALMHNIKLLCLYRGYSVREKLILYEMYLFLRAFYLKELYNIKLSLNSNSALHNSIMNSYLKKNIFKQDLIKECLLYLSFVQLFVSIESINSNSLLAKLFKNMTHYESNPLSAIELLNTSLFSDFKPGLLILNENVSNLNLVLFSIIFFLLS